MEIPYNVTRDSYIFFPSNSCQIDNINIFLNKKQPFSKLKNLIPTSKYKTLRLTGYSWGITDPTLCVADRTIQWGLRRCDVTSVIG